MDYATAVALITAWNDDDPDGVGAWVKVSDRLRTAEDWEWIAIALVRVALECAARAAGADGVTLTEVIQDAARQVDWDEQEEVS